MRVIGATQRSAKDRRMKHHIPSVIAACMIAIGGVNTSEAINLGGSEVPKERCIVYLGIGHSDFAGRNLTSADSVTHPRAWNYKWYGSTTFPQTPYDSSWIPAMEKNGGPSTGKPDGYNGLTPRGTGGPCMPFLKAMISRYPDYYFGIVTNAITTACVRMTVASSTGDENNYTKGYGVRYTEIISFAKKIKGQATIGGIICMFGEPEVGNTGNATQTFAADIIRMVADMRSDLGMPNLPFIIGCYEEGATGQFAVTTTKGAAVSKAIKTLPDSIPYCDTVSSKGCAMLDDHHYSTEGQQLWATRAADCIVRHGWLPTTFVQRPEIHRDDRSNIAAYFSSMGKITTITITGLARNTAVEIFNVRGERLGKKAPGGGGRIKYNLGETGMGCMIVRVSAEGMPYIKKAAIAH